MTTARCTNEPLRLLPLLQPLPRPRILLGVDRPGWRRWPSVLLDSTSCRTGYVKRERARQAAVKGQAATLEVCRND